MSDPQSPTPENPEGVDDVVGSANEGLAEAEAARDNVAHQSPDASAHPVPENPEDPDLAAFAQAESAFPGTFAGSAGPAEPTSGVASEGAAPALHPDADAPAEPAATATAADAPAPTAPLVAEEPAVTQAYQAPVDSTAQVAAPEPQSLVVPSAMQPIFVQAPEPPRPRGNRGAAGLIGLLAAIVFAAIYLTARVLLDYFAAENSASFVDLVVREVSGFGLWVTTAVFFIGFWLIGAIINRGRWGNWVFWGFVVGVIAYAGHILGALFEAPFWMITASQGSELVQQQLLAPAAIVAFIAAREITMWFGAWAARRGARMTVLNAEAQREYERTLEAGPQLPQ
ncbi:ABC transporter [Microbacterium sp. YY-01]|uniref:ABC transporter n=1 Tax=Microbacterium sp. YY-01 TaxID=3421634 RepID=UPI003D16D4C8